MKCSDRGFTLLETLLGVVILSALVALSLPNLQTAIERMRANEGRDILIALLASENRFMIDTGSYTADLGLLDTTIPAPSNFDPPTIPAFTGGTNVTIQIIRDTGEFTLNINELGVIGCTDIGTGICGKMGY